MGEKAFVLIVGGDTEETAAVSRAVGRSGHACRVVRTGSEAVESVRQRPPDVVVADAALDGEITGVDLWRRAKESSPETEVILIAADASMVPARQILSPENPLRAFEVIVRPLDKESLRAKVDQAAQRAVTARQSRLMREQLDRAEEFEGIVGSSPKLKTVVKRVLKLAPTKSTILIVGESGTGKELLARAIHRHSPRLNKAFVPKNCAALTESLLESELFGHVRGSFTGALSDRKGLIEAADGGTLFLDEIGDMPMNMQAKILRTLEDGEVMAVGSNEVRHADVRFVAATHRDLWERVEAGAFREDLFYRLHAHGAIRMPPLRERREDVPILAQYFIEQANREHGRSIKGMTPEAIRKLTNHSWRGNVRELRSVIERMVIEAEGEELAVEELPDHIRGSTDLVPLGTPSLAGLSMADVERLHILGTLKLTGGNREKAAQILQIGERTLYRKLKDYGIT